MDIRFAGKEDKPALMDLWGYCFRDGDAFIRWNFDRRYRAENTLVCVDGGEVCGMVQLLPDIFWVDEREIAASFVEGLAVAPHKRSSGVAGELMRQAFSQMKQRGHAMSFLIPFSPSFYQKLGYGLCSNIREVNLPMREIPRYRRSGQWQIARLDENTIRALHEVYQAYCGNKNCYQIRSVFDWENILQDAALSGGNIFLLKRDADFAGYVYYILQDGALQVQEMCFTDYEAFGNIMEFIRSHSPQAERALLRLPDSDPVVRDFTDSSRSVCQFSYAMARVIDAQAVLQAHSRHFYGDVYIRITDDICAWNKGVYHVREHQAVLLEKEESYGVSMDIQTLSELASGALSLEEAAYLQKIQGDGRSLDGLFPKRSNFMNLMFE